MGSKAKAVLNRLKEIDQKYKYKQDKLKISSDSSNSSNGDKVLRPILNIKLPDPYEEYVDSNSDESEHVAVRVVDDTQEARSGHSGDSSSEEPVKSIKENNVKDLEDLSNKVDEISEIIEDVSETIQEEVTEKSFPGNFSMGSGAMSTEEGADEREDVSIKYSDEILTDKYSDSFESPESDASGSRSVKIKDDSSEKNYKKSTSKSESEKTNSISSNYSMSNENLKSIASGDVTEKLLNEVEIEKKSSGSIKLSDIAEDTDENKLSSLKSVENNLPNSDSPVVDSKKTEGKSSNSQYESSNSSSRSTKSYSRKSSVEKSNKSSETIKTVGDNKFTEPTTDSSDYISGSTKLSSHKSIVKKSKKSSDFRQTVSDPELMTSENHDASSEYTKSSSHKSITEKSKKKTDIRQTVSDHEEYSSSQKKYSKSRSNRSLEEKIKQSHEHFKQEQHRLNSAMINYIQKMEEEHQRLLTWPKNLICPSRVNVKTVKPLDLPNISGFVRPDAKVNKDEDINMEILRNRLLDIRQWLKDQYLIYKEHCDLAASLNKTYTS